MPFNSHRRDQAYKFRYCIWLAQINQRLKEKNAVSDEKNGRQSGSVADWPDKHPTRSHIHKKFKEKLDYLVPVESFPVHMILATYKTHVTTLRTR
jgi:hypothetical protein